MTDGTGYFDIQPGSGRADPADGSIPDELADGIVGGAEVSAATDDDPARGTTPGSGTSMTADDDLADDTLADELEDPAGDPAPSLPEQTGQLDAGESGLPADGPPSDSDLGVGGEWGDVPPGGAATDTATSTDQSAVQQLPADQAVEPSADSGADAPMGTALPAEESGADAPMGTALPAEESDADAPMGTALPDQESEAGADGTTEAGSAFPGGSPPDADPGELTVTIDGEAYPVGQPSLDITGGGAADTVVVENDGTVEYYVDTDQDGIADQIIVLSEDDGTLINHEIYDPDSGTWTNVTDESATTG